MGALGMLAMALLVLALRQVQTTEQWVLPQKFIRISFWGLNVGLAMMVVGSLFPGGVLQLLDVLNNGYWHARGLEYMNQPMVRTIEWLRLPGDAVFIVFGVVPAVIATALSYIRMKEGTQ
jgi:nitric oxide reductase subunit B